jgi:hypothetical protein
MSKGGGRPSGRHCSGASRAVGILVVLMIAAGAASHPVTHAADAAGRVALEVLAITAIAVASAAVLGGVGYAAWRARQRRRATAIAAMEPARWPRPARRPRPAGDPMNMLEPSPPTPQNGAAVGDAEGAAEGVLAPRARDH